MAAYSASAAPGRAAGGGPVGTRPVAGGAGEEGAG